MSFCSRSHPPGRHLTAREVSRLLTAREVSHLLTAREVSRLLTAREVSRLLTVAVACLAAFGCRSGAADDAPAEPATAASTAGQPVVGPGPHEHEALAEGGPTPAAPSPLAPAPTDEPGATDGREGAAPAEAQRPGATPVDPEGRPLHLVQHDGSPDAALLYLVVEPVPASPSLPLVIALHGRGDTAARFAHLAHTLGVRARTIAVSGPLPFGAQGGRAWYGGPRDAEAAQIRQRVEDLIALVGHLRARYPDAPRPALYGFSQGAVVALQAAAEHPDAFDRVAALSGYLATPEGAVPHDGSLPILIAAGDRDGVIPAERSWAAADALGELGHAPERLAFRGPHHIAASAIARLRTFLAEGPRP